MPLPVHNSWRSDPRVLSSRRPARQVLGAEIEHRLPLDWPNQHGTVAALAQQLGSHVMEAKKAGMTSIGSWACGEEPLGEKKKERIYFKGEEKPNSLAIFNRAAIMRVIQQVGYLMRDQHKIMDSVLGLQAAPQWLLRPC